MRLPLFVVLGLSGLSVCSASSRADGFESAVAAATSFYRGIPEVAANLSESTQPVVIGSGSALNGSSQSFRVTLSLARVGTASPRLGWYTDFVRILEIDGSGRVSDITRVGLPAGSFSACYWVPTSRLATAGSACFEFSSEAQ